MAATVKKIPDGYHTVTPYLVLADAAAAIDFYKKAFEAVESSRLQTPDGKVMHAEIRIGDSVVMMCDEFPDWNSLGPATIGGTPVSMMLYVEDVDAVVSRAVAAGAVLQMPVADQFWGDRMGSVADPFGHKWTIATHIEDVSPEVMRARFRAFCDNQ